MTTNSNHYVPRLLLKGWCPDARARSVWVYDLIAGVVEERALEDLCCLQADKEINDLWNDRVEHPALNSVQTLRKRALTAASTPPVSLEKVSGLAQVSLDALFHLFWAFRSRHPQTPSAWGGLSEREYVEVLKDKAKSQEHLAYLQQKYQVMLLSLAGDTQQRLALYDYTVFPLPPVRRRGVLCLPLAPSCALLMMDGRLALEEVHGALSAINMGEVSHGIPGTIVCLPPGREWADPREQEAIKREVKAARLKWMPVVVGHWSNGVDL
jgi:hypothetical protein